MGFGINRVVVSGRLCKDPELRATRSGLDVMTVRLATEDRKKGADGAWVDDASYLDVVSFGGVAAAAASQLSKGSRVVFSGKVRQRTWEDVKKRHVGAYFLPKAQRVGPARPRAADLDALLGAEDDPERVADQSIVVGHNDPHALTSFLLCCLGTEANTRHPPSSAGPAANEPPSASTRSRMEESPIPSPAVSGAKSPFLPPLSSTTSW